MQDFSLFCSQFVINIIIFVISCVILVYFVFSYQRKNEELKVKSNNIETLLGEIERYKAQDSSNVVEIGILYMTIDELERYRNELIEDVEMLQIRNKDLESLLGILFLRIPETACP